jgi:nickel/cobalt transporter (NiCoT) family protein
MRARNTTRGALMRQAYTLDPGRALGEAQVIAMTGRSVVVAALLITLVRIDPRGTYSA